MCGCSNERVGQGRARQDRTGKGSLVCACATPPPLPHVVEPEVPSPLIAIPSTYAEPGGHVVQSLLLQRRDVFRCTGPRQQRQRRVAIGGTELVAGARREVVHPLHRNHVAHARLQRLVDLLVRPRPRRRHGKRLMLFGRV